MRREIKALAVILIICFSVLVYFVVFPQAKLVLEHEFEGYYEMRFLGICTLRIGSDDLFLIDEYTKIMLANEYVTIVYEREKESDIRIYDVMDVDSDSLPEIICRGSNKIVVFDDNLRILGKVVIVTDPLFDVFFSDVDGDGLKDLIFVEGEQGWSRCDVVVRRIDGREIFRYGVSEDEENYRLWSVTFAEAELDGDGSPEILALISFGVQRDGGWIWEHKTHILAISHGDILWEKTYDFGPIIPPIEEILIGARDLNNDHLDEIFMASWMNGYLSLIVMRNDGSINTLSRIDVGPDGMRTCSMFFEDINNDSKEELVFTIFLENNTALILASNENSIIKTVRFSFEGEFASLVHHDGETHLLFNAAGRIILMDINGAVLNSINLNTSSTQIVFVHDIDSDHYDEILAAGNINALSKLFVIDHDLSIIKSFPIPSVWYYKALAEIRGSYYIAIGAEKYISIYSIERGSVLGVLNNEEVIVPEIKGELLFSDIDLDNECELSIISSGGFIYAYDFVERSVRKVKIPIVQPNLVKFVAANLDGDPLMDFVIMDSYASRLIGVLDNGSIAFLTKPFHEKVLVIKCAATDIDGDGFDEIGIFGESFATDSMIIELRDNNGSIINSLAVDWDEENFRLVYFGSGVLNGSRVILLIYRVNLHKYSLPTISGNGSIAWRYDLSAMFSIPISVFVKDLDGDSSSEIIMTTFDIYHTIRLLKLGHGEIWRIKLDHPNITDMSEIRPSKDFINIVSVGGERFISLNYVYGDIFSGIVHTRFMLISLDGSIIVDKRVSRRSTPPPWIIPMKAYVAIVNNKLFGVEVLLEENILERQSIKKYYIVVHNLAYGGSTKHLIAKGDIKGIRMLNVDDDEFPEIILVKDFLIQVWELRIRSILMFSTLQHMITDLCAHSLELLRGVETWLG
ncbi:MAG: FG-GAP repeat domain-containing protein [Candidatus Njordarchaeales archaeon]